MPRARLRIAAELLSSDDERALRLTITDYASGIAAENLTHLFRMGYSTKSRATNSGLGRHWCAYMLSALGGRITAHSERMGRGTRFEIVVPLGSVQDQKDDLAA